MKIAREKKCCHCGKLFHPDPRNYQKQRYCSEPACRKASKAASQKKWVEKNPYYFSGRENVLRVQEWRKANPDYSKRRLDLSGLRDDSEALQDLLIEKDEEKHALKGHLSSLALQDLLTAQPAVVIGLISCFSGNTLQDDIAIIFNRMVKLGQDIINSANFNQGGSYDSETSHLSGENPSGTRTIQLDRSSPDP